MAHYTKITKVPVFTKDHHQGETFRITPRQYTTATCYTRVLTRVLETYMNGMEDAQEGSVDWDSHWILVGRVAVATNAQGQHRLFVFDSKGIGREYLDMLGTYYQEWLGQDDGPGQVHDDTMVVSS